MAGKLPGEAEMKILALDTTSPQGSVALLEDNELLGEITLAGAGTPSQYLLKGVDFLLHQFSLTIKDMEGYAVAAGPGSFTGIRVGLSTVKALGLASGKPIAPISGLKALAYKVISAEGSPVAVMMDARKGEVFAALMDKSENGGLIELVSEGAYRPQDFLDLLPKKKVYFIGSGVKVYYQRVINTLAERAILSRRSLFMAYEVGLLGWLKLKEGKGLSPEKVEPIYYRPSQAEEKCSLRKNQKKDL
jgi:tRNA threonylcarbamoyladenosine biosynthesis protein TsaB